MFQRASARARVAPALLAALAVGAALLAAAPAPSAAAEATRPALAAPAVVAPAAVRAKTKGPNCGKLVHRKPNGRIWRCSFAETFSGTKLNPRKWTVITSKISAFGKTREDCFVNTPRNISVRGGRLNLTSRATKPFTCDTPTRTYTSTAASAMVSSYKRYSQRYGRYAIRARFPYTKQPGLQASLWLWPKGASGVGWPLTGEIDIAEWYSKLPNRVIPYLHYSTSFLSGKQGTNTECFVKNVGRWHMYVLEWTEDAIEIKYDGKTCLRNTTWNALGPAPFDKPYFLSFMQALGLKGNSRTDTTPLPATTQIDFVRVWS